MICDECFKKDTKNEKGYCEECNNDSFVMEDHDLIAEKEAVAKVLCSEGLCKPKQFGMKIVPIKVKPNTDAIEMLEKAIEDLKSGELTSVGISWVTKEGSIGGDVSGSNNGILMWASLEHNAKSFYADIILA